MATGGEIKPNKILDIKDLNEVISTLERSDFPAGRWNDLGLGLHISQPKLDAIQDDNPRDVKGCLRGCLKIWLQQDYDVDAHGKPSLEKLSTAVKEMGLRAAADKIGKIDIIKPEGSSGLRRRNRIPVIVKSDIHKEFRQLQSMFAALVAKIREHLTEKVKHQKLETVNIARFVEEYLNLRGLLNEVSIDVLFNRIRDHYSYLNCSFIEAIVNEHFEKSCMECVTGWFMSHSTSDTYIIKKMKAYVKKMNHFKQSNSLKYLQSTIEDTCERIISSTDTSCVVVIRLNGGWDKKTISDLESLLKHYCTRSDIFNHLQITPGSVCISYLVPRSAIAHITSAVKSKSESMRRVGVFYFSINGDVLLDEKDNVNFNKSLIEAVKLCEVYEVSLLLSLGADPCYEDSNADKVLELAVQGGNEEIIELISIAKGSQFMELENQEELADKDDSKEAGNNGTDEELEVIIQRLQDYYAELEKSLAASKREIDELQLQKKKNETELQTSKIQLKKCYLEIDNLKVKSKEDMNIISSLEADVKVKEKTMSKQETEIAALQEAVSLASLQKKETEAELQKRLNAGYLENKRLDRLLAESKDESQVLLDKISLLEADVLSLKNELIIKEKMLFEETKSGTEEIEILQEKISSLSVQLLPPPSEDKFTQSEAIETMDQSVQSLKILLPEIDRNEMKIEGVLALDDLNYVLDLLKRCDFPWTRWYELGLTLGLYKNTLDVIEMNYPHNVYRCLAECLFQWLSRAYDVDGIGGATWNSLSDALRSMNENAAADKLDQESNLKLLSALAVGLYDSYSPLMFESLSDPVNVAIMLQREGVIAGEVLTSVESASPSVPNQREVLLAAVREAVQRNYNLLHTFASVLCKFTDNIELGTALLQDYDKHLVTNMPDILSVHGKQEKNPLGIFESHFPQLCDAVAKEHNIMRASSYFIPLISDNVFDKATTSAIPVYERAQALLMELRRNLKASSDQRQYLMQLISIFHKINDQILSNVADSMKSEL